jgi:CRP-like cAMP-binding protein
MSQLDMSNMVEMTYETVSRVLKYFKSQNVIKIDKKHISIVGRNRLKMIGNDKASPQ